jgi:arginase family enzyme
MANPAVYTIMAPCHQSRRQQGFQFGPNNIKEAYDNVIKMELFDGSIVDPEGDIKLCPGFSVLYHEVFEQKKKEPHKPILTVGGDHSISACTVGAINDYYMKQQGQTFNSDLMVLWIDAHPDLHNYVVGSDKDLPDMAMSSLMGILDPSISPQKLSLKSDQIVYFGLKEDEDFDNCRELGIKSFSLQKIRTLGPETCIEILKEIFEDKPIHVSIDMKVFNRDLAPSVHRNSDEGITIEELLPILTHFSPKFTSVDIVEFNPMIGNNQDGIKTAELARELISKSLNIKKKRLNVFNEDSPFLIYRSMHQEDHFINNDKIDEDYTDQSEEKEEEKEAEHDIGWYLLRGLSFNQKEEFLKMIPDGGMIIIDIAGEDYLVAKTTMNEQNKKSYLVAESIQDMALFPEEKVEMGFALIQ